MRRAAGSRHHLALLVVPLLAGCVAQAAPSPAVMRDGAPPWPAPRDAVSHIAAAGLPEVPLDSTDNQRILTLTLTVAGERVPLVPHIGIDRVRAVQAPVHTHDDSGQVWLEGRGTEQVTLADFFTVWGVRFQAPGDGTGCLGHACGRLEVSVDGRGVPAPADLRLVDVQRGVDIVLA